MPEYTYRREDGTTFTIRQRFSDEPLSTDPSTGQKVVRVVQPAGIIFKGTGFYVNDSKGSKQSLNNGSSGKSASENGKSSNNDGASASSSSETKSEKTETKTAKVETAAD